MKVYSIGREDGCDIIINDNTDVISRRHATINVSSSGKMTIVDYSHNGTYVNGIRISPNVPVPVTRKDNISFAHVARLDWNQIPNTQAKIIRYILLGVLAVILIIGGVWGYKALSGGGETPAPQPLEAVDDSTKIKAEQEKAKEHEKHLQDSIKKQVQDSLNKVQQKVPEKKNKDAVSKKGESKNNNPKKEEPKKEEPKKRFR